MCVQRISKLLPNALNFNKAAGVFLTEYDAFAKANKKLQWSFQLGIIQESDRPLGSFCPDIVYVMVQGEEVVFWPPVRKTQPIRRGQGPKKGGGTEAEGMEEDEPPKDREDDALEDGGHVDEEPEEGQEDAPEAEEEIDPWVQEVMALMDNLVQNDITQCVGGLDGLTEPAELAQDQAEPADPDDLADSDLVLEEEGIDPFFGPDDDLGDAKDDGSQCGPADVPPPSEPAPGGESMPAASSGPAHFAMRTAAEISCVVDGGTITYYKNKQSYEARCTAHEKCRMTRTCLPSNSFIRKGQGRPLGLLASWLAGHSQFSTKFAHFLHSPNTGVRKQHRLKLMETASGRLLLATERPQRGDSDIEPDHVP